MTTSLKTGTSKPFFSIALSAALILTALFLPFPAAAQIFLPNEDGQTTEMVDEPTVAADTVQQPKKTTWYDYPEIELRALDKITARATTFKTRVGETVRFGDIYIKVKACRKPPAIEKLESAAFIQVWEQEADTAQSRWVFSGWMFGSNPALSAMDHVIYDVWVIQCIGPDPEPVIEEEATEAMQSEETSLEAVIVEDDLQQGSDAESSSSGPDNGGDDEADRLIDSLLSE